MDTAALKTQNAWGEESLRSTEALVANSDNLSIRKLIGLLQAGALACGLDLLLEVEGDVAELLLDIADNFALGGGGESVTALGKDLHEVVGQVTSSHIDTGNGVWKCETLIDRNNVSDSVTGIENDTGGTAGGVQRENSLDRDVKCWSVECLKNDLCHLLSVGLWVDWSLGKEDWVLLWGDTQLVVESVMPDLLHIIPVGDNTVLNWVAEGKNTTLRLCLISYV